MRREAPHLMEQFNVALDTWVDNPSKDRSHKSELEFSVGSVAYIRAGSSPLFEEKVKVSEGLE